MLAAMEIECPVDLFPGTSLNNSDFLPMFKMISALSWLWPLFCMMLFCNMAASPANLDKDQKKHSFCLQGNCNIGIMSKFWRICLNRLFHDLPVLESRLG